MENYRRRWLSKNKVQVMKWCVQVFRFMREITQRVTLWQELLFERMVVAYSSIPCALFLLLNMVISLWIWPLAKISICLSGIRLSGWSQLRSIGSVVWIIEANILEFTLLLLLGQLECLYSDPNGSSGVGSDHSIFIPVCQTGTFIPINRTQLLS